MCAIIIFIVASMLCGAIESLWQFVVARTLQGVGGAMMVPVSRLIVLRETEKKDLVRAIAYLTWPALTAPVLGPPVGGLITTYASWRWIFFINAPIGLTELLLAWRIVPRGKVVASERFDSIGFMLTGIASVGFLCGFELIGRTGVDPLANVGLLVGSAIFAGFAIRRALRIEAPLLSISPFNTRNLYARDARWRHLQDGIRRTSVLAATSFPGWIRP
jgi:MFS family permease